MGIKQRQIKPNFPLAPKQTQPKDVGPKSVSEQLLTYPSPDSKLTLTCY